MNQNIEVINKNLWAVRFSLLPMIKEIQYEPVSDILLHEQSGSITDNGIMILNKEYPGYQIYKEWIPKIMKKKNKQLKREIKNAGMIKLKTDWQVLYATMLKVEQERRGKEGVKPIWER